MIGAGASGGTRVRPGHSSGHPGVSPSGTRGFRPREPGGSPSGTRGFAPGYRPATLQAAPPRHNHWIGAKSPGNVRPPTHVIRKYVVIDKRATPGQMRQHFKKAPSSLGVARLSMIGGGDWCSGGAAQHLLEGNALEWYGESGFSYQVNPLHALMQRVFIASNEYPSYGQMKSLHRGLLG